MNNTIDVQVCGNQGMFPCTYKTVVLKPNIINDKNILNQGMMNMPNTKYVIKYDFLLSDVIVEKTVNVVSTNVSQCGNAGYADALAAYNLAHDAWIDADNAYTNNPNETTLAAKNAAYAALEAAQLTLNGTPQYYYFAGSAINIKKGQHITIPEGCVLLNDTRNGIVSFDVAPNDMTVYIGSATTGNYDYKIQGGIVMPANCLIEFDGGSISDGVLIGDETILIFDQEEEVVLKNVELLGDFIYPSSNAADKKDNTDGMAKIYLKKNKSFASQLIQSNTIYVIQYDFTLGEDITVPENCVLQFEGGSLKNGTIAGNNLLIRGTGKGFYNIQFANHFTIPADLLGIMPNVDCTDAFAYYISQPLTIIFQPSNYYIRLGNNVMGKNSAIIGADESRNTKFYITPVDTPAFLLGVNYYSTIKNVKIIVQGNTQHGIDVLRIDNAFGTNDTSKGSWYQYTITNIEIEGVWLQGSDYSQGDTAIALVTNETAYDGSKPDASALSFKNELNNIAIKFFKCGVRLENKRDNGSVTPQDKYWQNSLLISNITITALIGIHFDRENVGNSSGYCLISNYIFQSTNHNNSFGLYGKCNSDMVSNYVSWDNKYLGYVYGKLYITPTAWLSNGVSQAVDYADTMNGFLVPEGETLILNPCPNGITYYLPNDYAEQLRLHKVDYTNPLYKSWSPASAARDDVKIENGIKYIAGSKISFFERLSYVAKLLEKEISDDNTGLEIKSVARQRSTGYYQTLENYKFPTINKLGQSLYNGPYNFKRCIQYVDCSSYSSVTGILVVRIDCSLPSTAGDSISSLILNNVNVNNGSVIKVNTTRVKADVFVKIEQKENFYLSFDYKVTSFTGSDVNEPDVTKNLPTVSIISFVQTVGTFAEKPTLTVSDAGFGYYCTDRHYYIYYGGDNKWYDSAGNEVQ